MNRPGFLLGKKCEGTAIGPEHFRLKELQDLARQNNIKYSGLNKDALCAAIREFYSKKDEEIKDVKIPLPKLKPIKLVPIKVSSTKTKVSPTKTKVSPTKVSPTPTKVSPTKVSPTKTKVSPTPTKVSPTKTKVSPNKVSPTPTKVSPTKTKVSPTKTKVSPTPTKVSPTKTKVSPTKTRSPQVKTGFYSDSNKTGYIRKLEYKDLSPDVPFIIFNLERLFGEMFDNLVTKSHIEPSKYIVIGNTYFIHKASVIFNGTAQGGHYTAFISCSTSTDTDTDDWYYYDDLNPIMTLAAKSHAELLRKHQKISTNGVLHLYTNASQEIASPFQPCATLGPQYNDNSCYMDSSLITLFALSNKYLLDKLLYKQILAEDNQCPLSVKQKIRDTLESMLQYFKSGGKNKIKFCTDFRTLFRQCSLKGYENFGNTQQQSPSEFISYIFEIFDIEGPGLIKHTWGTDDLSANSESLFSADNTDINAFTKTSENNINTNYIIEFNPFKVEEFNGKSTADLLSNIDDIVLV